MVWYDFAILALLVYTMWSGAQRGFVTQLAWIAALVLCFKFADKLAPSIEGQINVEQPLRHWIAMFVLYLAFSLGSFMVARILNSWLEKAKFKDFDRHLGGLLGLVKGGIIAMVITFFAVTLSESLQATVMTSVSGRAACYVLDHVEPITPDHFREYLQDYRDNLGDHSQNGDLGTLSSVTDVVGSGDDTPVPWPVENRGGVVRDIYNGIVNSGDRTDDLSTNGGSAATGDSFMDLVNAIPGQLSDSAVRQLESQWQQSSPESRQNLLNEVNGSFGNQVSSVLQNFMARTGQGSTNGNSAPTDPSQLIGRLNAIGDIYKDREYIVNQALSRLDGVPAEVQQAVIDDWYADVSFQRVDPDPSTARNTSLDHRILSQLSKRGIWDQLSLSLKQRLANSRQ